MSIKSVDQIIEERDARMDKSEVVETVIAKKPADRKAQSLKNVNLERTQKKLMNVLSRDTQWLLKASLSRPLERDEAHALSQYLKLVKALKASEDAELAGMSEEQLREYAGDPDSEDDDN